MPPSHRWVAIGSPALIPEFHDLALPRHRRLCLPSIRRVPGGPMSGVAVVGAGMTKFGRHLDRTLGCLAAEAVGLALQDAGLEAADIDAVVFSNSFDGLLSGQESIRGEIA